MYKVEYADTNTKPLYAVGCGLSLLSVHSSREEAEKAAFVPEDKEWNYYSHHSWGQPRFNFPYVLELAPGDLRRSIFYPDQATIENEQRGQAFNYVPITGLLPRKLVRYSNRGERYWWQE